MEIKAQFDYKKYRAQLLIAYDIELDETALAMTRILANYQDQSFRLQNEKIDGVLKNIDWSKTSLQVSKQDPKSQAFWFGFGKYGLPITFCALVTGICILVMLYDNDQENERNFETGLYKRYFEANKKDPCKATEFLKNLPFSK